MLFEFVDRMLYVNTLRTSRKARNVAAHPHRLITYGLGMSIPKLIGDPLHAGGTVELDASA